MEAHGSIKLPRNHEITMKARWKYYGQSWMQNASMEAPWGTMEAPCYHHGITVEALWKDHGITTGSPWTDHTSMRSPWRHHGSSTMKMHHGSAYTMKSPWNHHGRTVESRRKHHESAIYDAQCFDGSTVGYDGSTIGSLWKHHGRTMLP